MYWVSPFEAYIGGGGATSTPPPLPIPSDLTTVAGGSGVCPPAISQWGAAYIPLRPPQDLPLFTSALHFSLPFFRYLCKPVDLPSGAHPSTRTVPHSPSDCRMLMMMMMMGQEAMQRDFGCHSHSLRAAIHATGTGASAPKLPFSHPFLGQLVQPFF